MKKQSDIKESFSSSLRNCLSLHYGKIPSAAIFAKDFNLNAHGTTPITQESARRWMRGVSLPEDDRLRILIDWLDLDYNEVLRLSKVQSRPFIYNGPAQKLATISVFGNQFDRNTVHYQGGTTNPSSGNGKIYNRRATDQCSKFSRKDDEIMQLMSQLDANKRRIVENIIKVIKAQ